jgi:hypothetical protein
MFVKLFNQDEQNIIFFEDAIIQKKCDQIMAKDVHL